LWRGKVITLGGVSERMKETVIKHLKDRHRQEKRKQPRQKKTTKKKKRVAIPNN
jgi:hypothetical protein